MYFSKSTLGFYDNPKNYKDAPSDLVKITDDVYKSVCGNPNPGKILSADEDGYPILIDPVQKTNAQLMADELKDITNEYKTNLAFLNMAWLAAAVNDGAGEEGRKQSVIDDVADLKAQYILDVATTKLKYI